MDMSSSMEFGTTIHIFSVIYGLKVFFWIEPKIS